MVTLAPQIAVHGAHAGWRGNDLVTAVAVALAESQGFEGRAGGLWNLPGVPGGDPAGNAVKAFARWQSGGWTQWRAYNQNRHLLFWPAALAAVATSDVIAIVKDPGAAATKIIGGVADAAKDLPGADVLDAANNALTLAFKAGAWLADPNNWIRVAQIVIGGGMVIASLVMITRPDRLLGGVAGAVVDPIIKGAGKAVK